MTSLWARLFRRRESYTPGNPSPKDVVLEMRAQGRKAEAETVEIRRLREVEQRGLAELIGGRARRD